MSSCREGPTARSAQARSLGPAHFDYCSCGPAGPEVRNGGGGGIDVTGTTGESGALFMWCWKRKIHVTGSALVGAHGRSPLNLQRACLLAPAQERRTSEPDCSSHRSATSSQRAISTRRAGRSSSPSQLKLGVVRDPARRRDRSQGPLAQVHDAIAFVGIHQHLSRQNRPARCLRLIGRSCLARRNSLTVGRAASQSSRGESRPSAGRCALAGPAPRATRAGVDDLASARTHLRMTTRSRLRRRSTHT